MSSRRLSSRVLVTRRRFLAASTGIVAGACVVPRSLLGGPGETPPSEQRDVHRFPPQRRQLRRFAPKNAVQLLDRVPHVVTLQATSSYAIVSAVYRVHWSPDGRYV